MLPLDPRNRNHYFIYPEPAVNPGARPFGIGQHCINFHTYDWNGMRRGDGCFVLIQYTIRGRGELSFRGETLSVPPGCAMLLAIPEEHRYYLPESSDYWEVLYINLSGDEAHRIILELRERYGAVVDLGMDSPVMEVIAEQLLDANSPEDHPSSSLCGNTLPDGARLPDRIDVTDAYSAGIFGYRVLMMLADELENRRTPNRRPEFLDRVMEYCRTRLDREISIDDLAAEAGCSRWHLARVFKQHFGVPPLTMLNQLRLKLAFQLLRSEQLSVKEAALRCGFADTSYFVKVFRSHYGFTPGSLLERKR